VSDRVFIFTISPQLMVTEPCICTRAHVRVHTICCGSLRPSRMRHYSSVCIVTIALFAQIYVFGGRAIEPSESGGMSQPEALPQYGRVNSHFFSFDTVKKVWQRLPDGPVGTMLYDFVFVPHERSVYLHGGVTSEGLTKATLWSVRLFTDAAMRPLWTMVGVEGIGARSQHCAAGLNGTLFFWGGVSGDASTAQCAVYVVSVCVCVCVVCDCLFVFMFTYACL
jgi:hypothetical protein